MSDHHYNYIVLGAGISGLSAAITLQKEGLDVLVLEKESQSGGVLQSLTKDGFTWDRSAHTIAADDEILSFFNDLDLGELVIEPTISSKVRQLVINDRIRTISNNPLKLLFANFLSIKAKFQVLKEVFKRPIGIENPTVEEFFSYHFGEEVTRNIVSAIFSGIYAGDISKMEMRAVMPKVFNAAMQKGSVIKGMMAEMKKSPRRKIIGIKGGMEKLVRSMAGKVSSVVYNAEVKAIESIENGYQITLNGSEWYTCNHLISTLPSYALSKILKPTNPRLSELLDEVDYSSLALAHIKYPETKHVTEAFGFLSSQYDKSNLKGAIYNSTLFPVRTKEGFSTSSLFVDCKTSDSLEKEVELALSRFKELTGIGDVEIVGTTFWPKAIPQFNRPYLSKVEEIKMLANFELSGNFISGVSVTDCIKYNIKLAKRLSSSPS